MTRIRKIRAWIKIVLCHILFNWRYSQIFVLKKLHEFQKHIQSIEIMLHSFNLHWCLFWHSVSNLTNTKIIFWLKKIVNCGIRLSWPKPFNWACTDQQTQPPFQLIKFKTILFYPYNLGNSFKFHYWLPIIIFLNYQSKIGRRVGPSTLFPSPCHRMRIFMSSCICIPMGLLGL